MAVCFFLWLLRAALYPFVGALFIAYFLEPLIRYGERKGCSRLTALIIVYFLLFFGGFFFIRLILPLLFRETRAFFEQLPSMLQQGQNFLVSLDNQYDMVQIPWAMREEIDSYIEQLGNEIRGSLAAVIALFIAFFRHSLDIIISPVLAFYFLYDWPKFKRQGFILIPQDKHPLLRSLVKDVQQVIKGIICGQIIIAVLVGVLVTIGLTLLELPFALLCGVIAGFLDVIPYFGALLGAVPAVTLALLYSTSLAFKVALLFLLIHQIEGSIIGPKILGDSMGFHPLVVIFLLLAGGELYGVVGMLFAVPVAALLRVFLIHGFQVFR
ncbi:MAG: AI-2E family transporter [Sporomusaceae bacterium]|nr:AI-2E family transporter [Sporomusaceae bacterium]